MLSERKVKPMDKSKVIAAYKRGFITVRECGQILGVEEMQLERLLQLEERKSTFPPPSQRLGS
ncbi:hypothetical protein [Paenibacillus odorifer]|uniref:hypothetical protein n=1 Tax=Paenibacillus odorifer TaxID=189426 RepID=UPI00117DD5FE|nr:hypothetical protein [Paenibacillus odorifer]